MGNSAKLTEFVECVSRPVAGRMTPTLSIRKFGQRVIHCALVRPLGSTLLWVGKVESDQEIQNGLRTARSMERGEYGTIPN
jgi:hypothetical protein